MTSYLIGTIKVGKIHIEFLRFDCGRDRGPGRGTIGAKFLEFFINVLTGIFVYDIII